MTTSTSSSLQKRTFRTLKRRLEQAGLSKEFVRSALLPEWWERQEHDKDLSLLPEVEIAVARFLRTPIAQVQDPTQPLELPTVQAKLRKPKERDHIELRPAMFAALAIAGAVVRNLRDTPPFRPLPTDPDQWRSELLGSREAVTLSRLVGGLWERGIPVIHLANLQMKKFRGMACCVGGRPVILLAWGGQDSPRFLSDAAHEAGHIARGHVTAEELTVDTEDGYFSDDDGEQFEKEANSYSLKVLGGFPGDVAALGDKSVDGTVLAKRARAKAREIQFDAGLLVHFWAVKTCGYNKEHYALRVLDKLNGPNVLHQHMRRHVDFEGASETDTNLLRCVRSVPLHEAGC